VRVAGLITRVRTHQTKSGKMMAFVTLEDLQGLVELVVFPRTWTQYGELLEPERIVLVEGKVDAANGDPKVLVDSVSTEFKAMVTADTPIPTLPPASSAGPKNGQVEKLPAAAPKKAVEHKPIDVRAQPQQDALPPPVREEQIPAPPEAFPPDWGAEEVVPGGFVLESEKLLPVAAQPPQPDGLSEQYVEPEDEPPAAPLPVAARPALTQETAPDLLAQEETPPVRPAQPYILAPVINMEGEDLRMVTVYLRPGLDKVRDNLRLRQAWHSDLLPGQRSLAPKFTNGAAATIEFPNSPLPCPELLARLNALVGADNVIVEKLTIL
jgi:hypothetical protein